MKPIELIERALLNSSKGGDRVIRSVRRLVRRWQKYTGQTAVLARDGRSFEEVGAGRLQ
jgi:hypothetical protein